MEYTTLENKIPIKNSHNTRKYWNIMNRKYNKFFTEHVTIPTINKIKDQNNENMKNHPFFIHVSNRIGKFGPNYPNHSHTSVSIM